ncbi:hypothetical protein [Mycobacterium avium]|uniref:hypothetical protein n=1 Tax=Mycobacterium avium TaxID=1764 RepID=UPI000CE49E3C|nr:hypothetical protein [Mycobacterium avium]MBZ4574702.1 hypothetical protein [Mycobacterium avium subsp. hominissuis]
MAGRLMGIEADLRALGFTVEGDLGLEAALDEFCDKIIAHAKGLAPVFGDLPPKRDEPGIGDPQDYKNSIRQLPGHRKPGHRRVGSDDPKAVWIEFGSRHMPEYAVFTKTAKFFGGTGPIVDEGIEHAQSTLRGELEKLEKLTAIGAASHHIAAQRRAVEQARAARSAAFKAARGGRRGRRR